MHQSTVLISAAAFAALESLVAAGGRSRDATVRELLEAYVTDQKALGRVRPDRRLTHIGTVLHYPACLNEPGRTPGRVQPRRLPFRASPALLTAARAHAYRIPGHSPGRGHQDYSSRLLGDAIATAICSKQPFVEPELEGLPPTVEHGIADVLWQLTKAATMTHTEWVDLEQRMLRVLNPDQVARSTDRRVTFLSPELLDFMWHSPERSAVALALAHQYLGDPSEENHAILTGTGPTFDIEIDFLLESSPGRSGNEEIKRVMFSNAEGRAASRLWVRGRAEAHDRLARWLAGAADGARRSPLVDPPGWVLRWRPEWRSRRFQHGQPLPEDLHAHIAAGHVLHVVAGSRSAVWPLVDAQAGEPVAGFDQVIAGMRTARPSATPVEILEACLAGPAASDDPDVEIEDTSGPLYLWLELDEAHELALIDAPTLQSMRADNLAVNQAAFACVLANPTRRWGEPLSSDEVQELRAAATTDSALFFATAQRLNLNISTSQPPRYPLWKWPVNDLSDALEIYTGPTLAAFARCRMDATRTALNHSRQQSWQRAMWWSWEQRGGHDVDV